MNKQAVNPLKEVNTYFTLEFYVEAREGRYYNPNKWIGLSHRDPKGYQTEYDNYVRSYVAQIKKNIHRLPNVWQEVINNNSHLNNIDLAYAILREIDIRERL